MSLKTQIVDALKWSVAGRLASQIVTWGITIFIIRLLNPDDYGLIALAGIFTTSFSVLSELGLGSALVRTQDLSAERIRQIFGIIIISNIIVCLMLLIVVSYVAGDFFDDKRLILVIQLLSLQFILSVFIIIPSALLNRNMQFRGRAIIDFVSTLIGAVFTLFLAYLKYEVYSLVWGNLVQTLVRAIGLNLVQKSIGWPIFKFSGCGSIVKFGGNISGSQLVWMFYSQSDIFLVGKFLGNNILGVYTVAMDLASLPSTRFSAILNQILYPSLAKIQREGGLIAPYLLKGMSAISLVFFPVMWGMASISQEIFLIFLGEKWLQSAMPFAFLCVIMPFRVQSTVMHAGFHAVGRADYSFKITCIISGVMFSSFIVGIQFGLLGICLAWGVVYPSLFFYFYYKSDVMLGFSKREHFASLVRPTIVTIIMCGAVFFARLNLAEKVNPVESLVILIFVGVATYVLLSFLINRKGVDETLGLIRRK